MLDWLLGIKIKCSRCGYEWFQSQMYNINKSDFLRQFSFPPYINLCIFCHSYLQYHSIEETDDIHKLYNRYNETCRNFDIHFNLLDEKTNLYWNEVDFVGNNDLSDEQEDFTESITFKNNANSLIKKALHEKSTTACYEALKEAVMNSYETSFVGSMQNFITRLGLIVSDVSNIKFTRSNHYPEVLHYICNLVIKNNVLYKKLIKINKQANNLKHSKKNIEININEILPYYNKMIDQLISISNCNAFEICHIYNLKTTTEIECISCGRIKPEKYFRCKMCKKIVCDDCFNKEKKVCCECVKNTCD